MGGASLHPYSASLDPRLSSSGEWAGCPTSLDRVLETSSQEPEPGWVSEDFCHPTVTLYCADNGHARRVMLRCGDRTCGECRKRDFHRLWRAYRKAMAKFRSPKLVTLTLRNVSELEREDVSRLREALGKLFRREAWRRKVRGGLYSIEVVNKGRDWNVHVHLVIDADYIPQRELSRVWLQLTGDSPIVDVRQAWSPQGALKYVLKYLVKPPELVDGAEGTYNEVLRGVRLVQPFGALARELKMETPPVVCPECGCTGWITEFKLRRRQGGAFAVVLVARQFQAFDELARQGPPRRHPFSAPFAGKGPTLPPTLLPILLPRTPPPFSDPFSQDTPSSAPVGVSPS